MFLTTCIFYLAYFATCSGYVSQFSLVTHFANSRCPPYFNSTDCFHKISAQFLAGTNFHISDLLSETEKGFVSSLDKVLSIFENSHFLVVLTNFRGVELERFNSPIILKSVRLAWLWLPRKGWSLYEKAVYVNKEILQRRVNISDHDVLGSLLRTSPFWWRKLPASQFHSVLNISSYSMKTRAWNNLVSIALFPHIGFYKILAENSFVDYAESVLPIRKRCSIFPSEVIPIKLFTVHPSEAWSRRHLAHFISSLATPQFRTPVYESINYQTFFIFITTHPKIMGVMHQISFQNFTIIQLCQKNFRPQFKIVDKSERRNSNTQADKLAELLSSDTCHEIPNLSNLQFHFSFSKTEKVSVLSALHKRLQVCSSKSETKNPVSSELEENHIAEGYASVWSSIMGNFSYVIDHFNGWVCDNGNLKPVGREEFRIRFDIQLDLRKTFIPLESIRVALYPAVISSVYNDLRLIICGYQRFEKLPFIELLSAFEQNVWIALIISLVIVIVVFPKIPNAPHKSTIAQNVLVQAKLLLEQGSPLPSHLINSHQHQWLAGTMLLTGIVLSNAYKNTNVYNMIIHGKSVPYQYLQELVHDNFTIYTRSREIFHNINAKFWGDVTATPKKVSLMYQTLHFRSYRISSKLFDYKFAHESEISKLDYNSDRSVISFAENELIKLLLSVSSLMPLTTSFLSEVLKQTKIKDMTSTFEQKFRKHFFQMELSQLKHYLRQCERTAVVVPSHVGYEIVKSLEQDAKENAYQGEETYYQVNVVFILKGMIPQYLIQRVKYVERCGLWQRWQTLFKKRFLRRSDRKTEVLRRPTMKGHIVIIFTALVAGLVLSAICFGVESCILHICSFTR